MNDLYKQAARWAAIRHASAAWGSDEEGHMVNRLLDRIEELEQAMCQVLLMPECLDPAADMWEIAMKVLELRVETDD